MALEPSTDCSQADREAWAGSVSQVADPELALDR